MSGLLREQAPLSEQAWAAIDEQARSVLVVNLGGRKVVDLEGPLGWHASAVSVGRTESLDDSPINGVRARLRLNKPLVELRVPFEISRSEVENIDRGAKDADLDAVTDAATAVAHAEDRAIFHGFASAGIEGIVEASVHEPKRLSTDYTKYTAAVVEALDDLTVSGIGGPYALVLGRRCYSGLAKTLSAAGYPMIRYVRELTDGNMFCAPAIDGAVLLSTRGGDFELTVGRELAIGYLGHDDDVVRLYLEESFTFRSLDARAAVFLHYAKQ